jgi:uncharacterized repeat protein (TIGR01451 family)
MGKTARIVIAGTLDGTVRMIGMAGLIWLTATAAALADGNIELKTVAEQEVRVVEEDGREVTKRVPAAKVVPGDVVIYTITARNVSDQPVDNVVISDPIPEHMTYVLGSAAGEGTEITYSVDGGKSFVSLEELEVTDDTGAPRKVEAKDYTNIRWKLVSSLAPSTSKSAHFRARLD